MATSFPENLDSLINPDSTSPLSNPSHSEQHTNANDAIHALQEKVGVDGSSDSNSLDYKVSSIETQLSGLETNNAIEVLGSTGNNDLSVTGIENKTTLDSFDSNIWGTIKYTVQISHNDDFYSSEIFLFEDGTNINMSESNIISNTNTNLADIAFERNGSIINLTITPALPSVNARYYRTALKK